jgi:hypothetical protein
MKTIIEKPIQNPKESPYLDWIKSGIKKFEGRLKSKIREWNLEIRKEIKFYDQDNPNSFVIVRITSLKVFSDFGVAFDALGDDLIPGRTREEVIELYNRLNHYPNEVLITGIPSRMIQENGVVTIGFEIISIH